jgi:hypothetical protein
MRLLKTLGLIIFPLLSFSQSTKLTDEQVNASGAIKLIFVDSLKQASDLAKKDIATGTPFLLLHSGISPVVYSSDGKFEEKYKVYYYESGCTGPTEKFAIEYNRIIFEYLTNLYGGKWKAEIRKDVLGFKKWKRVG